MRLEPTFDALAAEQPDGSVSVVAMNKGEAPLTFTLYDRSTGLGAPDVHMPAHSIQSFVLPPKARRGAAATAQPTPTERATALAAALTPSPLAATTEGGGEALAASPWAFPVLGVGSALLVVAALVAWRHVAVADRWLLGGMQQLGHGGVHGGVEAAPSADYYEAMSDDLGGARGDSEGELAG